MRKSALCDWRSQSLDSPWEDLYGGPQLNTDSQKESNKYQSTLLKRKYPLKVGEQAGSRRWNQPKVVLGLIVVVFLWATRNCNVQWGSL